MRIFGVIFLMLVMVPGRSQDRLSLRLYTNVTQTVDFISLSRLNLGLEKDLRNKKSLSIGAGIYFHGVTELRQVHGFNLNIEYKKFFRPSLYYSVGAAGGRYSYSTTGEFKNNANIYNERYHLTKNISDFYCKFGVRKNMGKRFYFDAFAGPGLRNRHVSQTGRSHPEDKSFAVDFALRNIVDRTGTAVLPILKTGFVIGFRL